MFKNNTGAYVAGRTSLVQAAVVHLSAPGVDGGATFGQYKNLFQVSLLFTLMMSCGAIALMHDDLLYLGTFFCANYRWGVFKGS